MTQAVATGRVGLAPTRLATRFTLLRQQSGVWLFLVPALIFFVGYQVWPIIRVVWISFTDYQFLSNNPPSWVWFHNYAEALTDPLMWKSLWRAALFTLMFLPGTIILPLLLAILVDRVKNPRLATTYAMSFAHDLHTPQYVQRPDATGHLVAPTDGSLPGFAIFLDPNGPTGLAADFSSLSGQAELYFEGIIYLPKQQVTVSGTALAFAPAPYTSYIGDTLRFVGNGELVINNDTSLTKLPIPTALMVQTSGSLALSR